jgi:hypothetical protein
VLNGGGREGEQAQGRLQDDERRRRARQAAWQPLGIDGPTWLSGGRLAGAARAVGGVVGRRVEQDKGGADLQGLGRRPAAETTRAAESRGDQDLRKTKEDLSVIS